MAQISGHCGSCVINFLLLLISLVLPDREGECVEEVLLLHIVQLLLLQLARLHLLSSIFLKITFANILLHLFSSVASIVMLLPTAPSSLLFLIRVSFSSFIVFRVCARKCQNLLSRLF